MLNTKKLFTKLIPKIKTMTGTTDANGNLSLGLSESTAKSIIGITGSNYVYIPFVYAGNWYAKTVSSNSQSTPVINESVSVSIKYLRGGYIVRLIMSTASRLVRGWGYAEYEEITHENVKSFLWMRLVKGYELRGCIFGNADKGRPFMRDCAYRLRTKYRPNFRYLDSWWIDRSWSGADSTRDSNTRNSASKSWENIFNNSIQVHRGQRDFVLLTISERRWSCA